jgi:hypothetical protein
MDTSLDKDGPGSMSDLFQTKDCLNPPPCPDHTLGGQPELTTPFPFSRHAPQPSHNADA